jgi:hypothetical protein
MTSRRQTTSPVPLGPLHRRTWQSLWRRCSCGLAAPCVDRLVPASPLPFPPRGDFVLWEATPVPPYRERVALPASETGGASPSRRPRPPLSAEPSAPSQTTPTQRRCSSPEAHTPACLPADKAIPCPPMQPAPLAGRIAPTPRPALPLRRATTSPMTPPRDARPRLALPPSPTTHGAGAPTQSTAPSAGGSTRSKTTAASRALRVAMSAGRPPCAERVWYEGRPEPMSQPGEPRIATVTSLKDYSKHDIGPPDRSGRDDEAGRHRRPVRGSGTIGGRAPGRQPDAVRPQMAYHHINLAHW